MLEYFIVKRKVFRTSTIKCFGRCHGDKQWGIKGKEKNRFDLGVGKSFHAEKYIIVKLLIFILFSLYIILNNS